MTVEPPAIVQNADVAVEETGIAAALALVDQRLDSETWARLESIEEQMAALPQSARVDLPLNHIFTPGLYTRQIFMPAGTLATARIHLVEHPFLISVGVVSVWDHERSWITLRAHHTGVTKPGTRRLIYVHEDCIWSTFHVNPTNETDPDVIGRQITYCGGKFAALGAASSRRNAIEL